MECRGILNFVLIGAKNSGKTTYLSSLIEGTNSTIKGKGDTTTSHLDNIRESIKKNGEPESTAGILKTLCFTYRHAEFGRVDFEIDDYDGQFAQTISEKDKDTEKERLKLKENVKKSEGCIFLIPYESSSYELEKFTREIDRFIELAEFPKHNKSPIPAIIMVTKWDNNKEKFEIKDEDKEVKKYLENNKYLKRVKNIIESNFENSTIIPVSSKDKYHNIIKPIDYSLKYTFNHWHKTALEYKENKEDKEDKEDKEFYKFIKKIQYDTKFNKRFDKFNNELKEYERKKKTVKIRVLLTIFITLTFVALYFINLNTKTNYKKWMNETKICLTNSKNEKTLETIDSLIKQTDNNIKFVENLNVEKRLVELDNLKSQINNKISRKNDIVKLEETTTITEIINMAEEAFMIKSTAIRQIESFYPNYFSTKKGKLILESLKDSINSKEFEEILDEDVTIFIRRKEKFTKILNNIDDAKNIDDITHIDYMEYDTFDNLEKSFINDNLNKKIDIFIKNKLEEKPNNKMNALAIEQWMESISKLKNTKIVQINYIYKISTVDEKYIITTQHELDKVTKLVTLGINNISVKIVGYENNSIGFECGFFGFDDSIVVYGLSQILKYKTAYDCTNDTILFKNRISLKAKKYSIIISNKGFISYFDNNLLPTSIVFTKDDLYKLDKLNTISKSFDKGRIKLVFDKSIK